jgi:hypothetical protein
MAEPKDQETKQLTGDKSDVGLVTRAKESAVALKDRALEEAKEYKDPAADAGLEIDLSRLARAFRSA